MSQKQVYSLKAAIRRALSEPYFYSDKEEGASGAIDDGYLDAPSKE